MRLATRLCSLLYFHNLSCWPNELKTAIAASCRVIPSFITEPEELVLLQEIEPHMKRLRYEKAHWDDAIHLYREREHRKWSSPNEAVIQRMRDSSFPSDAQHITQVHVLDLHKDGLIKPHIDSVRYCGSVITGISLLSDAVMRLRHKDSKDSWIVDLLLPRRSLYRMGEESRYDFTHEILSNDDSVFDGKRVEKSRRISIICRDLPKQHHPDAAPLQMKPIPQS
ncbi:hypothetical protein Angca_007205 [Angiostrongylus cantonensis]|nr:hypothetical protein Angca_007205 [Angiostrongylus cantonensis]